MAQGLRDVAGLPDPVGEVVRGSTLANGLELRQVRVPFGVVGMVYEAPSQRHGRRGRDLPEVRQRGAAARLVERRLAPTAAVVGVLRDAAAASGLPRRRGAAGPGRQPGDASSR